MDEVKFFSQAFMPHGHCYFWIPSVLWTHVISDVVIVLAYYSIPIALFVIVRRRADLAFGSVFVLFATFIFACGTTHLVSIWTTWHGSYGVEGVVKAFTATVSAATAVVLWWLLPRILALPSAAELAEANARLAGEIAQRTEAERGLRGLNAELDARVTIRTHELAERARDLARSNRDLEQFAYVVSHDLKSPLRGVSQLAEWLAADAAAGSTANQGSHLGLLSERVHRMHRLVDGVMQYSRAGVEQRLDSVSPSEVAREIVAALQIPPGFEVHVAPDMPRVLYDSGQLLQVLQNLIANALHHMGGPPGQVRVRSESDADVVTILVEDDGVGIAAAHHERIFRMFQTLEPNGSGIGLAIVQKIVERHGGSVSVESELGRGSVFRFTARRAPEGPR